MKGISAMLASILLIAFTVAVGGIISVWMTGFTRTATGGVEATAANQTKCAGVYIRFTRVDSSNIILTNPSNQDITSVRFVCGNGTAFTPSTTTITKGTTLSANWTLGSNTAVYAYGLCLYSVPVEGSCKSGESCWTA